MSGSNEPISLCLSAATILRCPSLSQFQYAVILIPTVLEAIFTTSLAIINWNSGRRRHLLITSEGALYFILNVLDLLSHVLTTARENVDVFANFDVAIGVASFLPLFLYTFFLYIYSNSELLSNNPSLPRLLAKIGSLVLLFSIPAIVGANEVASFIGIQRIKNNGMILIGFDSRSAFTINAFFSSLTLALLILFQAVVFLIAFFRLIVAIINQRRFQSTGKDAAHLVNGVAWLSIGMKLGAVETLIGFAGGGFGIVLTRRIIRFLARACLCIAVIKGVDQIEDFRAVRKELNSEKDRSKFFKDEKRSIRAKIGNPRASTFRPLSATATDFHNLPRAHLMLNPTFDYNKDGLAVQPSDPNDPRTIARLRSLQELEGIATFASLRDEAYRQRPGARERVTVAYRDSNSAPTLHLRLPSGRLPSPTRIIESVKSTISGTTGTDGHGFRRLSDSSYSVISVDRDGIPQFADPAYERGRPRERAQAELALNEKQRYIYTQDDIQVYRQSPATTVATTTTMAEPDPIRFLRPNVSMIQFNSKAIHNANSNFTNLAGLIKGRGNDASALAPPPKLGGSSSAGRDSVTPSLIAESSIEIVVAPQRTVSQARATLYRAPSNAERTGSGSDNNRPGEATTTIPEERDITMEGGPVYTDEFTESPGQSYTPPPFLTRSVRKVDSSATVRQQQQESQRFRIVSEYASSDAQDVNPFADDSETHSPSNPNTNRNTQTSIAVSEAETLRLETVHELTKKFPGPPTLTYNGRPLMGGLAVRNIYESSAPTTPISDGSVQPVYVDGQRVGGSPGRQALDALRVKVSGQVSRPQSSVTSFNYASDPELGGRGRFDDGESDYEYATLPMEKPKLSVSTSATPPPMRPTVAAPPLAMATMSSGVPRGAPANDELVPPRAPFTRGAAPSHRVSAPLSLTQEDCTSAISISYSPANAFQNPDLQPTEEDPFSEIAVRTGTSRDFGAARVAVKPPPPAANRGAGGLLTPPVDLDPFTGPQAAIGSKRRPPSRIVWLPEGTVPPPQISRTPSPQPSAISIPTDDEMERDFDSRQTSMDEERRRQYSIDVAAHALSTSIPWLKNPEIEDEERELAIALKSANIRLPRPTVVALSQSQSSSSPRREANPASPATPGAVTSPTTYTPLTSPVVYNPNGMNGKSVSRIKSVGNVMTAKKKSTPVPTRPTRIPRKSLHLLIEPSAPTATATATTPSSPEPTAPTTPGGKGGAVIVIPTAAGAGQRMSFSGRVSVVRESVMGQPAVVEESTPATTVYSFSGSASSPSVGSPSDVSDSEGEDGVRGGVRLGGMGGGVRRDSDVLGMSAMTPTRTAP